jgi:serine/threonine protein kinase/formylglycine-generating enzyme required for sulfatase activity
MGTPTVLPEQFGRYRILRKLGEGGMGAVYLAEDGLLRRKVALKVPHFGRAAGTGVIERFYREAQVAAGIQHPNICPVHDVGEVGGIHYLTMPFVEGRPLSRLIEPDHPWPARQAVALVRQLALALAVMHRGGLIHRDLKPGNILVREDGEPVVMDFGLARSFSDPGQRMTATGQVMGTPVYMPPEQVRGEQSALGPGADVYSLGVILYELLTGQPPFGGPLAMVCAQILHAGPPPPSRLRPELSPELDAVCLKALAKQPEQRYPSMVEFAAALQGWLGQAEPTGPAPGPANDSTSEQRMPFTPWEPVGGTARTSPGAGDPGSAGRPGCSDSATPPGGWATWSLPLTPLDPTKKLPRRRRSRWALAFGVGLLVLACLVAGWRLLPGAGRPGDARPPASPEPPAEPQPGPSGVTARSSGEPAPALPARLLTSSIGMELVLIPAGKFLMGSPPEEKDRRDDEEQHEVEITRPFYLGRHEVTQAEYEKVMGHNPSYFAPGGAGAAEVKGLDTGSFPVDSVTWEDAREFCRRLSDLPAERASRRVYRQPTEAEWEYACRGGARESVPFHSGHVLPADQANFGRNVGRTTPVGSFPKANGFGLLDMHGNVSEWCSDRYDRGYYHVSPVRDPSGPDRGGRRVLRGGSWERPAGECRSAGRRGFDPGVRNIGFGFRVVCVPPARTP